MESNSFITRLYTQGGQPPSIFEMFAQKRLMDGVRPAFKFLFARLAESYPSFSRIHRHEETLYWQLIAFLEAFYLMYSQSTIAQNFYDLHMIEVSSLNKPVEYGKNGKPRRQKLTPKAVALALIYSVVFPMIRSKLRAWYDSKKQERGTAAYRTRRRLPSPLDTSVEWEVRMESFKRIAEDTVIDILPYAWAAEQFLCLSYHFAFLLNPHRFPYWDPYLNVAGLCVRMNANDPSYVADNSATMTWWEKIRSRSAGQRVAKASTLFVRGVVIGALHTLRILEWWYANEERLQSKQDVGVVPEAPPTPKIRGLEVMLPSDSKLCPLCGREKTNPACTNSGFTFCYPCIIAYVREHLRCPITDIPTREEDVRRLFFNS
eukprot:GDKJ01061576.1.p1 GENE.GDKJ01061576.1~~GDKJ01061576.1.p1  ORF type:complete len:375 (-),score=55.14 GDKJ01061576.1:138-1262(-)